MERLTCRRNEEGFKNANVLLRGKRFGPAFFPDKEDYKDYSDALERLAQYEDTGLSPEEYQMRKEDLRVLDLFKEQSSDAEEAIRIAEARRENRLVILPCKVGDAVYYINGYGIYKAKAATFRFNESGIRVYCERKFMGVIGFEGIYGKTVFLTREEAEAALKGATG